jgi:hypothetical protein
MKKATHSGPDSSWMPMLPFQVSKKYFVDENIAFSSSTERIF